MKYQMINLLNLITPLQTLLLKELPIKCTYSLMRNSDKIQSELKQFELLRNKLVEKYNIEIEGNNYKTDNPNYPEFEKELNELLFLEVEIDMKSIDINELGDIKISGIDLYKLKEANILIDKNEEKEEIKNG